MARASQSYHLREVLLLLCAVGSAIVIVSRLLIMSLSEKAQALIGLGFLCANVIRIRTNENDNRIPKGQHRRSIAR
jgi:hypothetical protein